MTNDDYGGNFGDNFGDFGDTDPFEPVHFDVEDDWDWESKGSVSMSRVATSRRSKSDSTESHGSSATLKTEADSFSGLYPMARAPAGPNAPTSKPKAKMELAMDMDDMFAQQQNHQDLLDRNDDDSTLSELTGLSLLFSGIPQYDPDQEDEEDPDLPATIKQFLACSPIPRRPFFGEEDEESNHEIQAPVSGVHPRMKSWFAVNTGAPRRTNSKASAASRTPSTASRTSSIATPTSAKSKKKSIVPKKLQFSTVSIRHYERILTENPSTILGPSIGIGWKILRTTTEHIDAFETTRRELTPAFRLVLNREQREKMLMELGYNTGDIAIGVRNNRKVRKQRMQTVQNLRAYKVEEALEGAASTVKKMWNPFDYKSKK